MSFPQRRRGGFSSLDLPMSDVRIVVPSLAGPRAPSATLPPVPTAGRLRLGDVDLAVGSPTVSRVVMPQAARVPVPALWLADHDILDAATTWRRLVDLFPETGLWPLVLTPLGGDHPARPWDSGELESIPLAHVDALDPAAVLAEGWAGGLVPMGADPYVEHLRPFGAEFPGLSDPLTPADAPAAASSDAIAVRGRIGLVPCRRPADVIASIGWQGAINRRSPAQVSAVLRSWEERFGTVTAGLGFATLTLLVPHPPEGESEALPIAAELAALCPDVLAEDGPVHGFGYTAGGSVAGLARLLVNRPVWKLWWD